MKVVLRQLVIFGSFVIGLAIVGMNPAARLGATEPGGAVYPRYLLLDARTAATHRGPVYHPGVADKRPAQAYAYGWFGAKAAPHKTIHRGYYRDLWIWRE
jgi:hypothetical protein